MFRHTAAAKELMREFPFCYEWVEDPDLARLAADIVLAETYNSVQLPPGTTRADIVRIIRTGNPTNESPLALRALAVHYAVVKGMHMPLTMENICAVHKILSEGGPCRNPGEMRTYSVSAGLRVFPHHVAA